LSGTISGDKRKNNSKLKNFAKMDQEARRVKSVVGSDDEIRGRQTYFPDFILIGMDVPLFPTAYYL
jgi:hypothetical protein